MKHSLCAGITFFIILFAAGITAQERRFGLGVMVGEPTGISGKLWVSSQKAFDFGLGWSHGYGWYDGDGRMHRYDGSYDGGSRVHLHMDYLWHWFETVHSAERFPLYTGIGGRLNTGTGYNSSVAIRGVFGIAWMPRNMPVDVFLELVPSLQVVPSTGFGMDAGFGARYFF